MSGNLGMDFGDLDSRTLCRANEFGGTLDEKLDGVRNEIWSIVYLQDVNESLRGGPLEQFLGVLRRYERFLAHVQYQRDHQLTLPGFAPPGATSTRPAAANGGDE